MIALLNHLNYLAVLLKGGFELCWNYKLAKGKHKVKLKILNPSKEIPFKAGEVIIYSDKPVEGMEKSINNRSLSLYTR